MNFQSQTVNHRGFVLLSILLGFSLLTEGYLHSEEDYHDNNPITSHLSTDHNNNGSNETSYDGLRQRQLGAPTIKAASGRFEQLVLEGSTVRLACPHARPEFWNHEASRADKFATNKQQQFQLPTTLTIQQNHKDEQHRRRLVKLADSRRRRRRRHHSGGQTLDGWPDDQVKWFRNHVPLQLNSNYFLSHQRPTRTTTTTTTKTTANGASRVYHSDSGTTPLELEDITSRLSELNQTDEQIVDSGTFAGLPLVVSVPADGQLATLENVNEVGRVGGRKLFKSAAGEVARAQRRQQETFDGPNTTDNEVVAEAGPLSQQWHINKFGELVIQGVSGDTGGKYTCVWRGEASELMLDVLPDESGDDMDNKHDEHNRKQASELNLSSPVASRAVAEDKIPIDMRHRGADNAESQLDGFHQEQPARQREPPTTLKASGEYYTSDERRDHGRQTEPGSVAGNVHANKQDLGDKSDLHGSSQALEPWSKVMSTTYQSGPRDIAEAGPVNSISGALEPDVGLPTRGNDRHNQNYKNNYQDSMSTLRQRPLVSSNKMRTKKQLQAGPTKRRPIHLVEAEIVSPDDLTTIPGLLYTKQQFHCPALRQTDLWRQLDAQIQPLIRAFCLDATRDSASQQHLRRRRGTRTRRAKNKNKISRCHRLARRLILRLMRGDCHRSNRETVVYPSSLSSSSSLSATATVETTANDLSCLETETSVLDVVWFKDGQRIAFDAGGKGVEPNPNVKLIDLLNQYSLSGVKVQAADGNNLGPPSGGSSTMSIDETSDVDWTGQSTTSAMNLDSMSQRKQAASKTAPATTSRSIQQGNMKDNNNNSNNNDSKKEEATGTRTFEMKWPACPLRGLTLEIDGIRRDNGGRYTCALQLSLEKFGKILRALRRLNEPSLAVKWANCVHDNDKLWPAEDGPQGRAGEGEIEEEEEREEEETEGGGQVDEEDRQQKSWPHPSGPVARNAEYPGLNGAREELQEVGEVVASNQKSARASPARWEGGETLQLGPTFGRWPQAFGAQIEPINGGQESRFQLDQQTASYESGEQNNNAPKQQQPHQTANGNMAIDEAIVLALGQSMQLPERAAILESILNGSVASEKSLSYIEQVVLMSNSSAGPPLTTLQSFSLIVSERPADSCSLWSTIREADDAYSRRKLADFKRLKRNVASNCDHQQAAGQTTLQIKPIKEEEDKFAAVNLAARLEASNSQTTSQADKWPPSVGQAQSSSGPAKGYKSGEQLNSIDYSTNSRSGPQTNARQQWRQPTGKGAPSASNVNHGINLPIYSPEWTTAGPGRDQNNALEWAPTGAAGRPLQWSSSPSRVVEPFNYANEANLSGGSGPKAVIVDAIDGRPAEVTPGPAGNGATSGEWTRPGWHRSTMDSLRRWLPILSFGRSSSQVARADRPDQRPNSKQSETKDLITNADHPPGNNIDGGGGGAKPRRKRSSGPNRPTAPNRRGRQLSGRPEEATTLLGLSSSALTNEPRVQVIDDSTSAAEVSAPADEPSSRIVIDGRASTARRVEPAEGLHGRQINSTVGRHQDHWQLDGLGPRTKVEVTPTASDTDDEPQTNREVDLGLGQDDDDQQRAGRDKRHDPSRAHKLQATTLQSSRYRLASRGADHDDQRQDEQKSIAASGHLSDKSATGSGGGQPVGAGQLNEAENSISRRQSPIESANNAQRTGPVDTNLEGLSTGQRRRARRQISFENVIDLMDERQEETRGTTTTRPTTSTTAAANDGSLIGSSSLSSSSSPWLTQANEEDDEALLWTAGQYLYLHMRAFAALSLYGVQVEVEWSNERVNGTNNIDFPPDAKTNNNNQQQQQQQQPPGAPTIATAQSDNSDQSTGAGEAPPEAPGVTSNGDQLARSHGPSPFATIDLVPGQNLHLECTAQALGRLPDVQWYKRIDGIPVHLMELGKKLHRQIGPDLYWPLTDIDLLDEQRAPVGSSRSPSRSFVCSQSMTIFDNLSKQTFTVVNSLQLSQYNDDLSWSTATNQQADYSGRKRRSSPMERPDDHYNLYACIVDADVRHSYATLGVHFRRRTSSLPMELRKRLQVRSMLDERAPFEPRLDGATLTSSSTGTNYNDVDRNGGQSAANKYNFLRENHLNFPMGSFWIPIKNGSHPRAQNERLVEANSAPAATITPAILSVIIVFVFSSLLALVYLTLKSYQALTNFQVDDEQLRADLMADEQQQGANLLIGPPATRQQQDERSPANARNNSKMIASNASDGDDHLVIGNLTQPMALDCSCRYQQQRTSDDHFVHGQLGEETTTTTTSVSLVATSDELLFAGSRVGVHLDRGLQTGGSFSRAPSSLQETGCSHLKDYSIFDSVDEAELFATTAAHELQHNSHEQLLYDVHYLGCQSFACRNGPTATSQPGETPATNQGSPFNQVAFFGGNAFKSPELNEQQVMVPGCCLGVEPTSEPNSHPPVAIQPSQMSAHDGHRSCQARRSKVNMIENPLNSQDSF